MSHKRKCGCVIADSKDRSVKMGYEMGGYIKTTCAEHTPAPQLNKPSKTYTKTEVEWIKQALKQRLIEAAKNRAFTADRYYVVELDDLLDIIDAEFSDK